MGYFTELQDYKTYGNKEEDLHFIYNANTGGGQSFLAGKFRDANGNLVSTSVLNGLKTIFQIEFIDHGHNRHAILLNDEKTKYDIKPRAEGDNNMKLGIENNKVTPNKVIAALFMLPPRVELKGHHFHQTLF